MKPRPSAKPKPLRAPILPKELELEVIASLEARQLVEARRIESCALSNQRAERVSFDGVVITGGSLSASKLAHLAWLDVVCERCDLSMIEWLAPKLTRVEFRGCRITGGRFIEGELENVRFVDCHIEYASFAAARFHGASFESCRLREADFRGADLGGVTFVDCDLRGADLEKAKLHGTDVSASELGDIRVGAGDVRGLVVSAEQAAMLAQLFGLVVRDR